jgi:hypothetical protein
MEVLCTIAEEAAAGGASIHSGLHLIRRCIAKQGKDVLELVGAEARCVLETIQVVCSSFTIYRVRLLTIVKLVA